MAKGKDKIAASLFDLEPTAILDLYRVYPNVAKKPGTYYNIHNGSVFGNPVIWQGESYSPIAIEAEGFEVSADGKPNRPTIKIANKDLLITSLLRNNQDFTNGKVVRKRTFVKFLDNENFDGGNPWGEPDPEAEISNDEYLISQKKQEVKSFVEFELTTPLDLDSFELNHRRIFGKYCFWKYRGSGCEYEGKPVERSDGKRFINSSGNTLTLRGAESFKYNNASNLYNPYKQYYTGDIVYIPNFRVRIQDTDDVNQFSPLLVYYVARANNKYQNPEDFPDLWEKDGCNKTVESCSKRFNTQGKQDVWIGQETYSQNVWNIPLATKDHMTWLAPAGPGTNIKWFNQYINLEGSWYGRCGSSNDSSLRKEFSFLFHFNETFAPKLDSQVAGTDYHIEKRYTTPLICTNATSCHGGFSIDAMNYKKGLLQLTCNRARYDPCNVNDVIAFDLLNYADLEREKVNILDSYDVVITIKKLNRPRADNPNGPKFCFISTEVTGVNKGFRAGADGSIGIQKAYRFAKTVEVGDIYYNGGSAATYGVDMILLSGRANRVEQFSEKNGTIQPGDKNNDLINWAHFAGRVNCIGFWARALTDRDMNLMTVDRIFSDTTKTKIIQRLLVDMDSPDYDEVFGLESNCKAFWQTPYKKNGSWYARNDLYYRSGSKPSASNIGPSLKLRTASFGRAIENVAAKFNLLTKVGTPWEPVRIGDPPRVNNGYNFIALENDIEVTRDQSVERDARIGELPFGGFPGTEAFSWST